jgi:hypothetical protein
MRETLEAVKVGRGKRDKLVVIRGMAAERTKIGERVDYRKASRERTFARKRSKRAVRLASPHFDPCHEAILMSSQELRINERRKVQSPSNSGYKRARASGLIRNTVLTS